MNIGLKLYEEHNSHDQEEHHNATQNDEAFFLLISDSCRHLRSFGKMFDKYIFDILFILDFLISDFIELFSDN